MSVTGEYVGQPIPEYARIIFIVVGIIDSVVGVIGNSVIIIIVVSNRSMHNPHFYFIANLACVDVIISGYVVAWSVVGLFLRYYPVVNDAHCTVNGFIIMISSVVSLNTLMVITVNRYLNICKKDIFVSIFFKNKYSAVIYIFLIWLVSGLYVLPTLIGWGRLKFDPKFHICSFDRTFSHKYTVFLLCASVGLPVIMVFSCNIAIWRYLRLVSHRIESVRSRLVDRKKSVRVKVAIPVSTSSWSRGSLSSEEVSSSSGLDEKLTFKSEPSQEEAKSPKVAVSNGVLKNRMFPMFRHLTSPQSNSSGQVTSPQTNSSRHPMRPQTYSPAGETPREDIASRTSMLSYLYTNTNEALMKLLKFELNRKIFEPDESLDPPIPEAKVQGGSPVERVKVAIEAPPTGRETTKTVTVREGVKLPGRSFTRHITQDELTLIKSLFVVFVFFAVLTMPYMVVILFDTKDQWSTVVYLVSIHMYYTNSCINWIIYGLMNRNFKRAYKKLFLLRSKSPGSSTTTPTMSSLSPCRMSPAGTRQNS